ncbi:hypothetical protein JX265_010298 [Neoarthrinium moseri]|uniref:NACHT-NTPase and P-loop NTPases N-terminal domain-containing protein n=1 Tax=Neoarthrinium moseri TaxID=1658444 RepID=A0A9Q0AKL6_9PEZI|nr:uncharacterized protein JN550_003503 [Neoarthrinium moseri]KAI1859849.1 hypothetical protein JX265_010298 [Neoarthrinium moseri]KAI1873250.1 hypothetical protein JN550_003503 [Neoarthrinium moseri]
MSGAEVIGLISGIIGIVDVIIKVYGAAKDATGLPSSFRVVVRRLPLIKDTLETAAGGLDETESEVYFAALKGVLEACGEKADALEKIFRRVMVDQDATRAERYAAAVRTLGKGRKVEDLMDGVLGDLQTLSASCAVRAATRTQLRSLVEESKNISEKGLEDKQSPFIGNYGTGPQSIHTGNGDQNVNIGSGAQFNGNFTGPFTFSSPANC